MNRATSCAFSLDQLFENFDTKKLKLTCEDCERINNDPHKIFLIKKIFRESVKIILDDIIENNVTFELPTYPKKSYIHIERYTGDKFKKGRKNGKWKDIDFLNSNFSGYQMELVMDSKFTKRNKPIYIDKTRKERMTELINQGKQYC